MAVPDKNAITAQAKKIMDSFVATLEKAGETASDFEVKREINIRDASAKLEINDDFRERMLENAPKKNEGFILAEKKKW